MVSRKEVLKWWNKSVVTTGQANILLIDGKTVSSFFQGATETRKISEQNARSLSMKNFYRLLTLQHNSIINICNIIVMSDVTAIYYTYILI